MKKTFRIYGRNGHRQAVSFFPSRNYDFAGVKMELRCSDVTHNNDFAELESEAQTEYEIYKNLCSQISDGIFENYRYGQVTEIVDGNEVEIDEYEKANNAKFQA